MPHSTHQRFPIIGVLALQGDYESHARALEQIDAQPKMVRTAEDLAQIQGLIIPGGESTTFLNLLAREGLFEPLRQFVRTQPTFGTCAGCILLATRVTHPDQQSLGALEATVERNAYGRQIHSEILTAPTSLPGGLLEMVFIRAPRIVEVGSDVEVLASRDGSPVLVRQKNILAATFHPELSHENPPDWRVHRYFAQMVLNASPADASQKTDPAASKASQAAAANRP
jgi:5'-phosphate synthase pdxT subunit